MRDGLAGRRERLHLSQEQLAEMVSVDPITIHRWESGKTHPFPENRRRLREALGLGVDELNALLDASAQPVKPAPVAEVTNWSARTAPASPIDVRNVGVAPRTDSPEAAMEAYREADRQVGGGHLYPAVIGYLQTALAPRLFGTEPDAGGRRVFTAAAALTEMAGWMAHDAGRSSVAHQHLSPDPPINAG